MIRLFIFFMLSMMGLNLAACDKNTAQQATTKADNALEAVDKQVDKVAQQPNALQPFAKSTDEQVKAAHTLVHPNTKENPPPNERAPK